MAGLPACTGSLTGSLLSALGGALNPAVGGTLGGPAKLGNVIRDVQPAGMSHSEQVPKGVKRPKWRLCFRLDRQSPGSEGIAWRHQRDFYVTVIDPPVHSVSRLPAPYFASEMACQISNLLVGRQLLEQLPGQTFENRSVAMVGRDCLTAGIVAAMLGARVALVTERQLHRHVQENVRMYLKDTLDYTKTKSRCVIAVPCSPGQFGTIAGDKLCEQLNVSPTLDIAVVTESGLTAVAGISSSTLGTSSTYGSVNSNSRKGSSCGDSNEGGARLFDILGILVPPSASTKILLICDGPEGHQPDDDNVHLNPSSIDPNAVPPEWQTRPFCSILGGVPVVWLERTGAEFRGGSGRKPLVPFRKYLPPMGASSSRCGCGGHPQRSFLNHRIQNHKWHDNHQKLKEALLVHNTIKRGETATVLEEARAWAAVAYCQGRPVPRTLRSSLPQCASVDGQIGSCDLGHRTGHPDPHAHSAAKPPNGGGDSRHTGDLVSPATQSSSDECPRASTAPPTGTVQRPRESLPARTGANSEGGFRS